MASITLPYRWTSRPPGTTVDMVKRCKPGQAAVPVFGDHPAVKATRYPDQAARSLPMIKHSSMNSPEGVTTSTLPPGNQANNYYPPPTITYHGEHPIGPMRKFTHRLPDEIYHYSSCGFFGLQDLVWLTTGQG